jgi:arylsulfatase A-like enzyme
LSARPNVLWIVWDTVRADHLGLHGYTRNTSPFLSEWSKDARVFENALSPAGYTLPSHASMFTGLLPSEHCANNENARLDDAYTTIAELLKAAGYRTFLYSANPHIAAHPAGNFAQGFDQEEHPWSPQWAEQALRLVRAKIPPEDRSTELPEILAAARQGRASLVPAHIKASGEIAQTATLQWLASSDEGRPFFIFLNYMEAHRPYIPPRRFREQLLSPADVDRSYRVDRSWNRMWAYTFGLGEYSDDEIMLTRATYDATLIELDELLRGLLEALREAGHLDDTIVILTADHGEQLGEHHMLDHQYSVYQTLLHVPLIVRAPGRLAPGRDPNPVMSFDLFPTLLELTGVAAPSGLRSQAVSLLAPQPGRVRFAEDPSTPKIGMAQVMPLHPGWDPSPFQRRLRTLVVGTHKLIWGSDGRRELYDLSADPLETRDLIRDQPELATQLGAELDRYFEVLAHCTMPSHPHQKQQLTPEQQELLKGLGYLDDDAPQP